MTSSRVGFARRPFAHSVYNGDDFVSWRTDESTVLCVVDGLGKGEPAAHAAAEALVYVNAHRELTLPDLLEGCSDAVRSTRGVSMNIARIDAASGLLSYASVGANRCILHRGRRSNLLPGTPGVVGSRFRAPRVESVQLEVGDLVILYTDGVRELLELSNYDTAHDDADSLARNIIDDWSLGTDDAAVMVYRKGRR